MPLNGCLGQQIICLNEITAARQERRLLCFKFKNYKDNYNPNNNFGDFFHTRHPLTRCLRGEANRQTRNTSVSASLILIQNLTKNNSRNITFAIQKGHRTMRKPELLAPGGSLEKLKTAIDYGADAVYIGGEAFSLRAAAENFSRADMIKGLKYAHDRNKKVYLTANIIPHNADIDEFEKFVDEIKDMGFDAVLIADLGLFDIMREKAPHVPIHISTQANNVNYRSAIAWYKMGAKRVVLGREMSFKEIAEFQKKIPQDLELEAFIHGAMCISYSGRCLLSNYMTGRDSNMGACAHPCRWNYKLVEETRPGEYMDVFENERGTFIFNSKDLCMIRHIPELIQSGITSFKIEGRVKTAYYVATVISNASASKPRPCVAFPCGSRSTSKTLFPLFTNPIPKLMAVVVFPTPPF